MLTPTHWCLANLFSRFGVRGWARRTRVLFSLGAVFPDFPALVVGCSELVRYLIGHPQALRWHWIWTSLINLFYKNEQPPVVGVLFSSVGYYDAAIFLRHIFHNFFFWAGLIILTYWFVSWRKNIIPFASGAILFHVFVDWPTHMAGTYHYFWPLPLPSQGYVSYGNPWLMKLEAAICAIWFVAICLPLFLRGFREVLKRTFAVWKLWLGL